MRIELAASVAGIAAGSLLRWYMIRVDYRNYPSYPHGYLSHFALGVIASFLGSVALPALVAQEYTAVTFLALAAQQFREVRGMVRDSLLTVEAMELVRRGPDYIEGIARTFEGRSYLVMMVAVLTSGGWLWGGPVLGAVLAVVGFVVSWKLMSGRTINDIGVVKPGKVKMDGPSLYVENIFIMNVGHKGQQDDLHRWGRGIVITPRSAMGRDLLASAGQRQAILHDLTAAVGIRKDIAAPELTPLARRDMEDGRIGLFIAPMEVDEQLMIRAVERVPLLEAALGGAVHRAGGGRNAR